MEERLEVKAIQVSYKCPKCNIGYLISTGIKIGTYPSRFPHKCDNPNCDYREICDNVKYPYIAYEPINFSDK